MREITDHKLNGLNDALTISVLDEPGQGGACHEYEIRAGDGVRLEKPTIAELEKMLASPADAPGSRKIHILPDGSVTTDVVCRISFQNGPIQEAGVNGISGEALLAVVIDRLRCFQKGPFNSEDNAIALTHLEGALSQLQKRTRDRLARGVEGTSQL